jgi:hypothetical protein
VLTSTSSLRIFCSQKQHTPFCLVFIILKILLEILSLVIITLRANLDLGVRLCALSDLSLSYEKISTSML